ncbi:MAG: amidohydrolase [Candidatus Dormibacteraeota bacterium]|nr:amidohydrolase [Candidatus Dormibacteraeota bacterium]MBO0760048.1 amidohydrolase [Candidatus Dormibacteraeota bacterium]
MRGEFSVIDVDAHYLESIEAIAEYMDEPFRTRVTRAPNPSRLLPESLGDRMVEGRIQRDDVPYQRGAKGDMTPDQITAVMGRLGVDATIMVANRLSLLGHLSVRDLAVAFCDGYIKYMLDQVVDIGRGIYTMPVVPWQDPEAGAMIVERVADNPAVVGACFMSSGANPPLGDVHYNPVYEAAQAHDLPIVFHSDPSLTLVEGGSYVDGLQRLIEAHSLGFVFSNMVQLTSLLIQGVPERFPKLQFVFQEAGLFWVPMMMYRLDEYYLKRRSEAPLLKGLPSEYIRDRCWFGTQPIEAPKNQRYLQSVFEAANGYDRFLFASDYPHFDYDDPSAIINLGFLDREQKGKVLAGNAMSVFNLRRGGIQEWESTQLQESKTYPREAG